MKLVKSLIVLAAVLALGLFVYFKVYKSEESRKAHEAKEGMLVQFNLDTMKRFTLVRPDSSVVFERGTGRIWNIVEPVKTEASGKQIYGLFEALSQSSVLYDVDDKPKDLKPYGLDHPVYYLAMEYDEDKPDTLFLGNDTPTQDMTYVKFASGRKVMAVSNGLTELLKKPLRFYRSRTVLNVISDDIQGFEISRGDDEKNRIQMTFNGVAWMMDSPWKLPADPASVEELLKKIGESNKMTLNDENATVESLKQYGLDKPSHVLNIQLKYGMPDKMLLIGNRLTEKGQRHLWYAKQFDNSLVFTIENSLVTLLDRDASWFIDKQPLKLDRNIVDRIVLTTEKEKVTLSRDAEGKWSAISPVDRNVPEDAIASLFGISRFILVNDVFAYEPTPTDLAKSGVDKPKFVLEFFSGDQSLARVLYGKTFTKENLMTYFQTSLSPVVYVTASQVNSSINYVLETVFGKK